MPSVQVFKRTGGWDKVTRYNGGRIFGKESESGVRYSGGTFHFARKPRDPESDKAVLNSLPSLKKYGGIDFNANNLNLKAQGDKIKFDLPASLQDIQPTSINGVTPVIINITPITNFHFLIGLSDKEENKILTAQRG